MNDDIYIQNDKGIVFKATNNHYLKLSPWADGEDRRVHEEDLGDYKIITYKNACMIVNSQFDGTVEEWEHKGKKYIANSLASNRNVCEHSYLLSTLPSHKVFLKDAQNMLEHTGAGSMSITSEDGITELKLIKHKGKLYFILILNEFLPRVKAYSLMGEFVQWLGIEHCKPIFNMTDNKYI